MTSRKRFNSRIDSGSYGPTAADFSSKPHSDSPSPEVFREASIGIFCDGNPEVRHDGVTVTVLTLGGPADAAGIKAGDVILAINDHYVFTIRKLQEEITHHEPGTNIALRCRRHSTIYDVSLSVGRAE